MGETNSFVAKKALLTPYVRLEYDIPNLRSENRRNSASKMSYVDAHIHLADTEYSAKIGQVMANAAQHNVSHVLSNATDYQSSLETIRLAKQFPDKILAAVGVHPSVLLQTNSLHLEELERMIDENRQWVAAIGEIGLDGKYTQDEGIRAKQNEVFRYLLALAKERNLPVVVHSRQAIQETLDTLAELNLPRVLLHWYDGPLENLTTIKDRGYFISIGPALLYSRKITEITRAADQDIILSETDGPVAYRNLFGGKPAEPSFVLDVVDRIAEVRGLSSDRVRSIIFSNFMRFIH